MMNRRTTCLALVALVAACDPAESSPADAGVEKLASISVLSQTAWPGRFSGDRLVRHCGAGSIDGVIVNIGLASDRSRLDQDPDFSVSSQDLESDQISGTQNLSVRYDCVDPSPDISGASNCEGTAGPLASTPGSARYRQLSARGEARQILFLVDVSGSTSGFVDVADLQEYPDGKNAQLPTSLQPVASDFNGLRWRQLKETLELFRTTDRVGIVAFREGLAGTGLDVPCHAESGKPWLEKLWLCFGGSAGAWKAGIDELQDQKNWGRSNMWQALSGALGFFDERSVQPTAPVQRHIVVVTDGPDTCGQGSHASACATPCKDAVSFDAVRAKVASMPGVSIHFIHFDAEGYRGPSAAMMDMACVSGGHYRFINSASLPKNQPAAFQSALARAFGETQLALSGTWQVDVPIPALSSGALALGTLHSLAGEVTLSADSRLVARDDVMRSAGGEAGVADRRAYVRTACGGPADCGITGVSEDCTISCSDEGLCLGAGSGAPAVSGTACGSGGSCCTDSGGLTQCLATGQTCDTCP